MPTGDRREDDIIRTFLKAYEDRSWEGVEPCFPDKEQDGGIDAFIEKNGRSLAIEHTLIEPFLDERRDRAIFDREVEAIRKDKSLEVEGRITYVYVPVGIFNGHRQKARDSITKSIHAWLKSNVRTLPEGWSEQGCTIVIPSGARLPTVLTVRSVPSGQSWMPIIGRQPTSVDLNEVVRKALDGKLPKLAAHTADKRLLMLERQHPNSTDEEILDAIERLAPDRPALGTVDEIWFVETMAYETEGILDFCRRGLDRKERGSISTVNGSIRTWWDESMPYAKWEN